LWIQKSKAEITYPKKINNFTSGYKIISICCFKS